MIDPLLALSVFAIVVIAIALLTWPTHGLAARLRRGRRAAERVRMEDALKHLFKCEYRDRPATLVSVAGALEASQAVAAETLAKLREVGLVERADVLRLTGDGRTYALRIIRTHRLWERYLADRTGVAPGEWHERAERQEHHLSEEEVDRLDARLGRPRYDPHGDPIPTSSGELVRASGRPLTDLAPGASGVITHLEDEPRELYDRLLAAGLSPRMRVKVLEAEGDGVTLEVAGSRVTLDAMAAGNVTVEPRARVGDDPVAYATLDDVPRGGSAVVGGIAPACTGAQRRRLLDLGIVPGTRIVAEMPSPTGDPIAYRIRGALIALRRDQQRWIRVSEIRERTGADAAAAPVADDGAAA
ncbi:MAG: iron dependent repressor, metal binding and dimerization domain protein [Longimicrobiales bacterium]|nr:iron dependent repressor, metal binding and dimerization domain protein [Longimicrobiales bacterium]